ncbi:MAG: nitric oxide reductase activation protein NorD [Gammaproteobacteria bacterium]
MAEPEELLTGAARVVFARLRHSWRNRRPAPADDEVRLAALAPRLELLLLAVTGRAWPLRPAAAPLPPTLLARVFDRARMPFLATPLPATDGATIWLPPALPATADAVRLYRAMALQQAVKARRGSAQAAAATTSPRQRGLVLLLETLAADAWLAARLPGTVADLRALRAQALAVRAALVPRGDAARKLEAWVSAALSSPPDTPPSWLGDRTLDDATTATAAALAASLPEDAAFAPDCWTGRLEAPAAVGADAAPAHAASTRRTPRSARLRRPPRVREALPDEDREQAPGHFSLQADSPLDHVEDPQGLQRPADRDADADAGDLADAVADLDAARLVRTPGQAHEVLLSELQLPSRAKQPGARRNGGRGAIHYPEWDHRAGAYRVPGAAVYAALGAPGDEGWVMRTLAAHRGQLALLRRRFEQLRARRITLRRQRDGSEPDLDACIADRADARAGLPRTPALYLQERPARRDLAVLVLTDVSGSTDSWIAGERRVIDVEREALLLVCAALDALGEPYAVMAFSGESAQTVELRTLKRFDERESREAWRRIAALEPERYTRVGAALRHATATLRQQAATHRLLLLLSDGRPNDVDDYDGPYGVHDLRQAIHEAKAQGVQPFCVTVDRTTAEWLPAVFGRGGYALLQQPERLPAVLVEWLRRLVTA